MVQDMRERVAALVAATRRVQESQASVHVEAGVPIEEADDTGAVRVALEPTGRLSKVQIAATWQDRLVTPDGLVAAIRLAAATALSKLYGWGTPEAAGQDQDWTAQVDQMRADAQQAAQVTPNEDDLADADARIAEQAAFFERASGRPRSEVEAELVDARARLDQVVSAEAVFAPGEYSVPGRLSMAFLPNGALTDMTLDSAWAAGQSGVAIMNVINEVLAQRDEAVTSKDEE